MDHLSISNAIVMKDQLTKELELYLEQKEMLEILRGKNESN